MRYVGPYLCESCDFESPVSVSCVRCNGPLIDREGRGPCRRRVPGQPYFLHGKGGRIALSVATAWTLVAGPTLILLANRGGRAVGTIDVGYLLPILGVLAVAAAGAILAARRVHATQEARWLADEQGRFAELSAAAVEADRISDLEAGSRVRFRGRVRVLENVGGFAAEQTADDDRLGGRFLIEDETGAALFDDDCFELWCADGLPSLNLVDGDEVEIVGQGSWVPSRGLTDARSYRGGGQLFRLDGTPDAVLHLRRLPAPLRVRVASEPGDGAVHEVVRDARQEGVRSAHRS